MDVDTTSSKGAHARFLREFAEGGADILLGTQMVAKGLDFPNVTLVGVISADTQILLPDFRSSERTFQLLTQVAGRTGRSALGGEVIIQTLQSDHYSLKYVRSHDFNGFYREELAYRRELDYPPFSRIVLIEFRGPDDNGLERIAAEFADLLRKKKIEAYGTLLGPSDAPIRRISNLFRKQIVFKNLKEADPAGNHSRGILLDARGQFEQKGGRGARKARLIIDVDPQGMM
jgi:primosomal protein N' (replication factor Y)